MACLLPPRAQGVVVQIEPMRTILRDDSGAPIYMNNSEVTGFMVSGRKGLGGRGGVCGVWVGGGGVRVCVGG